MSSDQKNLERVFIHDLASPLAVALGLIDLSIEDAASELRPLPDPTLKRLENIQTALLKARQLMSQRRAVIAEESKPRSE